MRVATSTRTGAGIRALSTGGDARHVFRRLEALGPALVGLLPAFWRLAGTNCPRKGLAATKRDCLSSAETRIGPRWGDHKSVSVICSQRAMGFESAVNLKNRISGSTTNDIIGRFRKRFRITFRPCAGIGEWIGAPPLPEQPVGVARCRACRRRVVGTGTTATSWRGKLIAGEKP